MRRARFQRACTPHNSRIQCAELFLDSVVKKITLAVLLLFPTLLRAADDKADLTFRIEPGQSVKYVWRSENESETKGRNEGKPFTLKHDSATDVNISLRGLPRRADVQGTPISIRADKYSTKDIKANGEDDKAEFTAGNGKIKATQFLVNEKGEKIEKKLLDSDNDIGLDEIKNLQTMIKQIETGEMKWMIDSSGKFTGDPTGELQLTDLVRAVGVEGLPRLLAGREVKVGEKWTDSQDIPYISTFKLAKPAVVRSTGTFKGWEEKNGKKYARLEIEAAWDPDKLNGESSEGMLVEITRVQGVSTASCLFDPATGQFLEGRYDVRAKYRLDGAQGAERVGLDVTSKMSFSFKRAE